MNFILSLLFAFHLHAEAPATFDQLFKHGIDNYKKQAYDDSEAAFQEALKLRPNTASILTNLALVEYQKGHKGAALAYLRKSLLLDSQDPVARTASKYINGQFQPKDIPHEILFYDSFRNEFLNSISEISLDLLAAFVLFIFGWFVLSYLGQKKRQRFSGEEIGPFYLTMSVLTFFIFLVFISLAVLKNYDVGLIRATIIKDTVSAYSAPDAKSTALFDLYEGLEVQVERVDKDWIQVSYPGALTGWIPKDSVMASGLRDL